MLVLAILKFHGVCYQYKNNIVWLLATITVKAITDIAMGKTLQIACTVMILVTVMVNMTNAQGEVISIV